MKKLLIALTLLLVINNAFGQSASLKSMAKIEGGFGGFGFAYEAKLGKKFAIDLSTGLSGRYEIYNNTFAYIIANGYNAMPAIYISANPRFYYNVQKRLAKGKNVENNAANYLGVKLKVVPHLELPNPGALINLHWGLQRSFGKHHKWLFNTHAGVGYGGNIGYGGSEGMVYPSIDFKFAYILSKMKNRQPRIHE